MKQKTASSRTMFRAVGIVIPAITGGIIIINIALFIYIQLQRSRPDNVKTAVPKNVLPEISQSPTPTPYPLPQGKQVYRISTGANTKGPKVKEISVNPYDPKLGVDQIYSVKVTSEIPVTAMVMDLKTDSKSTTYDLRLQTGTPTDGTWEVIIPTDDTHNYLYSPTIRTTDATGNSRNTTLTFRAY